VTDENELDEGSEDTPLIKQLRQQLKEKNKEASEGAAARRELAFIKAGVDVESKVGKLFAKTFEGDLSNIEDIRKEAEELGVYKAPPAPAGEPGKPAEGLAATPEGTPVNVESTGSAERQALANGAEGSGPEVTNPKQVALDKYREIVKAQGSDEDAQVGWLATMATAKAKEIGLTEHRA